MADNLLNAPAGFDAEDERRFAVQIRNWRTVKERNETLAPSQLWFRTIAKFLFPVGADAFEKSLIKLKDNVHTDGKVREAWEKKCGSYDNENYEKVLENLNWLPWTMNDVYVLDIVARITSTKGDPKTMVHFLSDHVVGPGVRAAFKANVCLWLFYSVFPFLAYSTFSFGWWECQKDTFANYKMCVMALYLPVVLAVIFFEYKAMIYALPPQVAISGPFFKTFHRFLPKGVDSFVVWFLFASFMSLMAHMDLATNSLFLSKVLATERCGDMGSLENAWQRVFSKCAFKFLANHVPSLSIVVVLLWLLLFSQFFYGVVSSVPTTTETNGKMNLSGVRALMNWDNGAFYEVKDRDQGGKDFGFKTYPTVLHKRTQHGSSLHALAESGRMYTLRFNSWSLQQELVKLKLYKSGQVYREVVETVGYFVVFMWCESIVQLELQGSALELGKAMSPTHDVDMEMAASLLLSVLMTSYNLYVACRRFTSQTRACLSADVEDRVVEQAKYNKRVKIYCYILIPIFVMVALFFGCCLLHAVMKTVMVSFYCDCGWNVRLNPFNGCVKPESTSGACFIP